MGNKICKNQTSSSIITINTGRDTNNIQTENRIGTSTQQKPSNENITQSSLSQQENQDKQCQKCLKQIVFTVIQINCQKHCCFHPICIEEHIRKLIEQDRQIIKCQCGTKINTNFLRVSSIPGKMNLLSKIFDRQLDGILQSSQQIRRDIEIQNYVKQNRQPKEQDDYILIDQNTLIYEETIQ